MTSATNAPNMYDGVIKDWSQYKSYYQSMHSYAANGDTTGLENVKSQFANEVVNAYLNDGDDSTNIDYEGAMSFVNMAYAQYSSANPVQRNNSGDEGNAVIGDTGPEDNFNISAPIGMTDGVVDWGTYDTQMQMMHNRLSGNEEEKALDMRKEMATSIMNAYNSDDDAENDITMEQALSYVDARYQQVTGRSIITTIGETTKGADSFWNKVPIVNWFIDNTTAEDLYEYMEDGENAKMNGKKANDTSDNTSKLFMGVGVTGGAALGVKFGCTIGAIAGPAGSAAGAAVGALVGAGIGFVCGLGKNLLDA